MNNNKHFLIIDGYSKSSRQDLETAGMKLAHDLYADMLKACLPEATYEVLLPSDEETVMPTEADLERYDGILWTGCNLCIVDTHLPTVSNQIELAKQAYKLGIPSFGSCWGLQIAVVAAGGKVGANPKGKEMGIARKIVLTAEGQYHPMFQGKPEVYEAFISHDDMVIELPEGGEKLAGNSFTSVQAVAVTHLNGTFWAVQYHPEYDLNEMACLIIAREEKLINAGLFNDREDMIRLVEDMKKLSEDPKRKDLRWRLAIDDDVLSESLRIREFNNWIQNQINII